MSSSAEHRPSKLDISLVVRDPIVVSPDISVLEAIAQMQQVQLTAPPPAASGAADTEATDTEATDTRVTAHQRIRASGVLVVADEQYAGILTTPDIVGLLSQAAGDTAALAEIPIGEAMRAGVRLYQKDWVNAAAAIARLQQQNDSHLVILNAQGYPLGVVTCETLQPALNRELQNQRRIEALLADSERRYASLTALAPVGILRTSAAGRCTYVNEYYCQILQLAPEALVGQMWDYRLHPDDRDRVIATWERSVQANEPSSVECRLYRADGAVVWIHNRSAAEYGSHGQITGYVSAATDITESKRAEAQLQSLIAGTAATTGQDFFPALARHISETLEVSHVAVAERHGEKMQTLARCMHGELLPNTVYDLANTLCEEVLQRGSRHGSSPVQQAFPEDLSADTGQSHLGVLFRDSAGEAIGTLCVFDAQPVKDLQRAEQILRVFAARASAELERQRATSSLEQLNRQLETKIQIRTAELQEQKRFLQTVLDTLPVPVFWLDGQSTYLGCNQAFAAANGLGSPADLIGKTITDVVRVRSESEGFMADNQRILETGRSELGIQESYTGPNGEQKRIETSKAPLLNLAGDVVGIVATFQDVTEREQSEQALRNSEQRFRSAIANAPFPISIHAEDGEVIQISAAWTELTGYTHADIPTMVTWAQLAYGDRAEFVLENYIRKLYSLESRWDEGEFTITTQEGSQRIWQFSSAPLGALADGRRLATSMAVDVTERRRAELALRESEERYRTIYNQAALGLISFSAEGSIIDVNPSFCQMLGYSREELLSKTALQLTYPGDHAEFFPAVARLFTDEQHSFFKEKRCLRKDGSHFWVGATVSIVRDSAGQIKHALGVLQDISARKQHEAERERAEAQSYALLRRSQLLNRISSEIRASLELDTILHNLVHAVVAELAVDSCTFGWYTHSEDTEQGLAQLEVIWEKKSRDGASCLGTYSADLCPLALEHIASDQPFRVDRITAAPDVALADHLQQIGLLTYFCLPIHTAGGKIGSLQMGRFDADQPWTEEEIELFYSIANQVAIAIYQAQLYEESQAKTQALERSYRELQDAQIHMVQAEKMSSLGQLVAGIAHEINNPVGFIYGNLAVATNYVDSLTALVQCYQQAYPEPTQSVAQLLHQADVDYILTDFPKLLASMENGATRIQAIVQSLRTFSRLEQAGQSAVDINQRIENTLVILQNRLNGRAGKPEIAVVKRYGDLPQIECYGSLLDQVFINLLVNAVDAIEERQAAVHDHTGRILITTALSSDRVLISIQDNGIGMDAATQASIFNPFFTTKPIGVGTGMGLSISYQIVAGSHNGRLDCRSIPGEGTEFIIEIPSCLS